MKDQPTNHHENRSHPVQHVSHFKLDYCLLELSKLWNFLSFGTSEPLCAGTCEDGEWEGDEGRMGQSSTWYMDFCDRIDLNSSGQ